MASIWGDKKYQLNWPHNDAYTDDDGSPIPKNVAGSQAKREFGKQICGYTERELREGLEYVKRYTGDDDGNIDRFRFIDIADILKAVEECKFSASQQRSHKTFAEQKAEDIAAMRAKGIEPLEQLPCSREQNKSRMASMIQEFQL